MKRQVKVAYWDTEQGSNPPSLIGQIQGTPTIKLIVPSKKNKMGKFNKKNVLDYNGAREKNPMQEFAESNMPNFVEKIKDEKALDAFLAKGEKYGLPRVLVFSKKPSSTLKALSTEFRRKLLIGEIKGTSNNKALIKKFNIKDFPTVLVLQDDGNHIAFDKKPSYNSLSFFLAKHALSEPVYGAKPKADAASPDASQEKTEL